jgi:hypothetical protein
MSKEFSNWVSSDDSWIEANAEMEKRLFALIRGLHQSHLAKNIKTCRNARPGKSDERS